MKLTPIVNYIMTAALVSVIILTMYAWTVYNEKEKQYRLYDGQGAVCMDCFQGYDLFCDDCQLYSF